MQRLTGCRAFTLIEVLIAMTILFALVTSGLVAFHNAQSNNAKATQVVRLLGQVDTIRRTVRAQLLAAPLATSGAGNQGQVSYQWQADTVALQAAPPTIDADSGVDLVPAPRFRLVNIKLNLSSGEASREFEYQELVWLTDVQ